MCWTCTSAGSLMCACAYSCASDVLVLGHWCAHVHTHAGTCSSAGLVYACAYSCASDVLLLGQWCAHVHPHAGTCAGPVPVLGHAGSLMCACAPTCHPVHNTCTNARPVVCSRAYSAWQMFLCSASAVRMCCIHLLVINQCWASGVCMHMLTC